MSETNSISQLLVICERLKQLDPKKRPAGEAEMIDDCLGTASQLFFLSCARMIKQNLFFLIAKHLERFATKIGGERIPESIVNVVWENLTHLQGGIYLTLALQTAANPKKLGGRNLTESVAMQSIEEIFRLTSADNARRRYGLTKGVLILCCEELLLARKTFGSKVPALVAATILERIIDTDGALLIGKEDLNFDSKGTASQRNDLEPAYHREGLSFRRWISKRLSAHGIKKRDDLTKLMI